MVSRAFKRWGIGLLIGAVVVAMAAVIGYRLAVQTLKTQIEMALGAASEIGAIEVGLSSIKVLDVRIPGPPGWPAEDALRAGRIVIVPDLRSLLSDTIRIQGIVIEDAYLSVLRSREGKLRLLPSLLEAPARAEESGAAAVPAVVLGAIELRNGAVEFYDATVRRPWHKLRLEQIRARVNDLRVPEMTGRTGIVVEGTLKGVQRDGTLAVRGWAEFATRDSEIVTRLRGIDMVALQPYLIQASETGVRKGTLDLDLQSTVKSKRLRAPGTLTLTGLQLDSGGGTFMGMPRRAVVGMLKDRNDRISIRFTLEGNLDDPSFSLNETFAMRVGASAAQVLGISIEGLARGVGTVGQKGAEAVGDAAEGVGNAFKKLFGK